MYVVSYYIKWVTTSWAEDTSSWTHCKYYIKGVTTSWTDSSRSEEHFA